jgi:hypothetical protein
MNKVLEPEGITTFSSAFFAALRLRVRNQSQIGLLLRVKIDVLLSRMETEPVLSV